MMDMCITARAEQHAKRVLDLAGKYLQTKSEVFSEKLVDMYEETASFQNRAQ